MEERTAVQEIYIYIYVYVYVYVYNVEGAERGEANSTGRFLYKSFLTWSPGISKGPHNDFWVPRTKKWIRPIKKKES